MYFITYKKEVMIMKTNNVHGGDLDIISRTYNIPKEEILNFSGNVNPLGIPQCIKKVIINNIDSITVYPDVSYITLREAISSYTGVKPEHIMVGNGSTELISTYIKSVKPKHSIIVSPAYSEYNRELSLIGSDITLFPLEEKEDFILNIPKLLDTIDSNTNLLVICNPNNPTGSSLNINQLEEILLHCKTTNTFVMIDETYVEFSDDNARISAMPLIKSYDNLFIIRGTSKFFACPGLRLGYSACSNTNLLDKVANSKDPWSVNILAALSGCVMFTDKEFICKTKELITTERNNIINELSTWNNIKLYSTQSNFFLIKLLREDITSDEIFSKLIKDNLLIRDASDFPYLGDKFLRFCILMPQQNQLLLSRLKAIIEGGL